MAFKINGNVVDLSTITSTGIDFEDQIVPYSRGCATAPTNFSFTDDQRFLRDRKLLAYMSSAVTVLCSYTDNYGLVKNSYRTGTLCCCTNYIINTNTWTENNDTQNVGGLCPDRSNHSAKTYHARYTYDSRYYNRTSFMCYSSWSSARADNCLKFLYLI